MYNTCEFCGLVFENRHSQTYCPYCRSTHLLVSTPMEIILASRLDSNTLESFYPDSGKNAVPVMNNVA